MRWWRRWQTASSPYVMCRTLCRRSVTVLLSSNELIIWVHVCFCCCSFWNATCFPIDRKRKRKLPVWPTAAWPWQCCHCCSLFSFMVGKCHYGLFHISFQRSKLQLMSHICHPPAYHYSVENRNLQDTVYTQQRHMDRIFSHFTGQKSPTVVCSCDLTVDRAVVKERQKVRELGNS